MLYGNSCSIADRERVIGPALAPIVEEHISNCSKEVDSGIVKPIVQYTHAALALWPRRGSKVTLICTVLDLHLN